MHRDIKPANILIGSNGQVKVADFGIARAMNAPTESNLTQAGAVMGTATYFSPEQAQGAQPDPRSDLYSLGIVMYEMVAGRPPFTGENPVSIAYKQVHDNPQPLNQLVADVPRPYEAIVAKLLAKDPKVRYTVGQRAARRPAPVPQRRARCWRSPRPPARPGSPRDGRHADRRRATTGATVPMAATTASQRTVAQAPMPPAGRCRPAPRRRPATTSRRRRAPGWYALAAFFALIALGIGGVLLFNALSGDDAAGSNALPDYVGMTLEEAIADLEELGLKLPVGPRGEHDRRRGHRPPHRPGGRHDRRRRPGDHAVLQPAARSCRRSPTSRASRSRTPSGSSAQPGSRSAQTTLEESDEIAENAVIRTDPPAGEQVEQATTINLVVSSGPRPAGGARDRHRAARGRRPAAAGERRRTASSSRRRPRRPTTSPPGSSSGPTRRSARSSTSAGR